MIFVGNGDDFEDMRKYAREIGIEDECVFMGRIVDRERLRGLFCVADLFLFPSDYDTNGLVVREAAACSLPCVLIRGSGAAEGTIHGRNCVHIDGSARELAEAVIEVCKNREVFREMGERASREIYISWETAVTNAYDRYQDVIKAHSGGVTQRKETKSDTFINMMAKAIEIVPTTRRKNTQCETKNCGRQ